MKRLALFLILLAIFLKPGSIPGAERKCIKGDCVNGYGIMTYPNGSKYEGEWKDNKKEGFGTFYYSYGSTYRGYWKNNKKDGLGEFNYYKGGSYIGYWKNNQRHGIGRIVLNDGGTYLGEWKDDKIIGEQGRFSYPDGSKYIGKIVNYKRADG